MCTAGPPEDIAYEGVASGLQQIWVALRASVRAVLEEVTLADIVEGAIPDSIMDLAREPDAWERR